MTSFLLDKNMALFCYSLLFFKLYTNIFECLELPVTRRTDRDKTIPLSLNTPNSQMADAREKTGT